MRKGIISFEVISDTHISTEAECDSRAKLRNALESIKRNYPEVAVIINAGDFTEDGSEESVSAYFGILSQYDEEFSFLTALGNHDVRWQSGGWEEVYQRYMKYNSKYMGETNGKVYFHKKIAGYHFIVLNTEWEVKDRTFISQKQLDWLDATLAEVSKERKPIFVVNHQSLYDSFKVKDDAYDEANIYGAFGAQDHAVKAILRKYPQTILFSGHLHAGIGATEVVHKNYGTLVNVPCLKYTSYGEPINGELGYHVTVYEDEIHFDLRDYANDRWIAEHSYTVSLDQKPCFAEEQLFASSQITSTENIYTVETTDHSAKITWSLPEVVSNKMEPAYVVMDGVIVEKIESGATDVTLDKLAPNTTYSIFVVHREKTIARNYREVHEISFFTKGEGTDGLYEKSKVL